MQFNLFDRLDACLATDDDGAANGTAAGNGTAAAAADDGDLLGQVTSPVTSR